MQKYVKQSRIHGSVITCIQVEMLFSEAMVVHVVLEKATKYQSLPKLNDRYSLHHGLVSTVGED